MGLAGKDIANPTAMMLAAVNMLRANNLPRFGDLIFKSLSNVYAEGKCLTPDVGGTASATQFTKRVLEEINKLDQLKTF